MKRIFALFLVIAATGILLAKVTVPSLAGGSKPELLSVPAGEADGDGSKFSTRTYPLSDFTDLDVSNAVKVIYTQGDSYKVQLTGRTDWLDLMEVTSKGGTLKVQAKSSRKFNNVKKKDQPDGEHNFILHLTAPCLQNIILGGVRIQGQTPLLRQTQRAPRRGVEDGGKGDRLHLAESACHGCL